MQFRIDEVKRQVILQQEKPRVGEVIINEFDTLTRKFLNDTGLKYECELVLARVEVLNELGEKTGAQETKAFARRKGFDNWLMEFIPQEYELGV